jgi:hypothetical protein
MIDQLPSLLRTLFGPNRLAGPTKVQRLPCNGVAAGPQVWVRSAEAIARFGDAHDAERGTLAYCPAVFDGEHDSEDDVAELRAIVLDFDGKDGLDDGKGIYADDTVRKEGVTDALCRFNRAEKLLGPATALVLTGYGFHAVWGLAQPLRIDERNRKDVKEILRLLAGGTGADESSAALNHYFRIPGTTNWKGAAPRACRVVAFRPGARLRIEHAADAAAQLRKPKATVHAARRDDGESAPQRGGFDEAWRRYREDHPIDWDAHGRTCPACGHRDCFGPLDGDRDHWACFSSRHREDSGGVGVKGGRVWHGDALDLDAHAAGLSRIDLLVRDGYVSHEARQAGPARDRDGAGAGGGTVPGGQPAVRITTAVEEVLDDAEAALSNTPQALLYQRGGQLVRVMRDESGQIPGLLRPVGAPRVGPVPEPHLFELMARSAQWFKWSARSKKWVPALPPKWAVQALAARGQWRFPHLEGIAEAPVLRPDGTVLDRPGYDQATGLLFEPSATYPLVPTSPSPDQVKCAVKTLLEPFREFPFVRRSDRAAAVAAALTLVGRYAIAGPCPMFAVLAPTPGTGKGLLVQVVVLLATGRSPVLMAAQHKEEELKKIVTTIAMEGHASVLFDNAEGTFGGATLAAALTTTQWTGRILGVSKTITAPLLTVWYVTGNNLVFVGDTFRRIVPIHLDAGVERPEEREFDRPNLPAYVRSHRPRILVAALTVLRGFFEAGRPSHGLPRIGSFEAWDDLVRSCVIWALEVDPCEGREAVREEGDADVEAMHALFAAWESAFPRGNAATVAAAIKAAAGDEALRDAIAATDRKEDGERLNGRALGYALRRWRGRVCGGRRLERVGNTSGGVLWRVVRVAGDPPAEERGSGDEADGGDDSTAPHSNTDSSPSNSPAYEWKHHHHDPHHHSEPPGGGDGGDDSGADDDFVEVLL